MPSPEHEAYRKSVLRWCRARAADPESDVEAQLLRHGRALAILWELDLALARPILAVGYATNPRGGKPWDPVVLLRCFLLMLLVGQPSINKWIADLAGSRLLRVLAGFPADDGPGVATLYDYLDRLHDGQLHGGEDAQRPSDAQRRRAQTARPPQRADKPPKAPKRGRRARRLARQDKAVAKAPVADPSVTAQLVEALKPGEPFASPLDLLERLGALLRAVAVRGSLARGLLGAKTTIAIAGDGSPLRTGANQYGKRACDHRWRERCDCPRIYADPDARVGWDHYREQHFFGHHFYEIIASVGGHDLPLAIRLDPANTTDHTASLRTLDRLFKVLPELGLTITHFIADAGHDSEANHRYCLDHGVRAVIPLRGDVPAQVHGVAVSKRGIPTCEALVEMAPRGSAAPNRPIFMCPVVTGKLPRCPLAPEEQHDWRCKPGLKGGPTVTVDTRTNPRLFTAVPRNSPTYTKLYKLRSGCERSNSVKKVAFKLEEARHRRASYWLIRLHFIAVLQHAMAWVNDEAVQPLVDHLLGRPPRLKQA